MRISSPVRVTTLRMTAPPPPLAITTTTLPPTRQITRDSALRTLVGSPLWAAANADDRRALLSLLDRLDGERVDSRTVSTGFSGSQTGYDAFVLACQATRAGTPLLLARSHDGRRVFDHLLTIDRAALAGLLLELADPGRIDQGKVGTCSVTAMQVSLATYDPAEYARVACGLLAPAGVVQLRSGKLLRRDDNGISADPTRTLSERTFQSAMMQAQMRRDYRVLANDDEGAPYDEREITSLPLAMKILVWIIFPFGVLLTLLRKKGVDQGLDDAQVNAAASDLFGTRYRTHDLAWARRVAPDGDFRGRHVVVAVSPFRNEAHALLLERIEADAVILRNPWGSQPLAKRGDLVPGAPKGTTYEDPSRGTIRVTALDRISSIHAPG